VGLREAQRDLEIAAMLPPVANRKADRGERPQLAGQRPSSLNANGLIVDRRGATHPGRSSFAEAFTGPQGTVDAGVDGIATTTGRASPPRRRTLLNRVRLRKI